jgi:hypothetical protein
LEFHFQIFNTGFDTGISVLKFYNTEIPVLEFRPGIASPNQDVLPLLNYTDNPDFQIPNNICD